MSPSPIPFATIGTSWITDSFIQCAHSTGLWQLVAIYSRNADTAAAFAAKYNLQTSTSAYTSISALASNPSIRAVYIASPNSLHDQQARQFLDTAKTKKHLIIEKPATSNAAELEGLYALADAHGVFLLEAYRHLHEANFHVLRDVALPKLGTLGAAAANAGGGGNDGSNVGSTVYGASLTYASYSSRYDKVLSGGPTPNIFSLDFSGGSLVDLGVYPISLAISLFGLPDHQTYTPIIIPSSSPSTSTSASPPPHSSPRTSDLNTATATTTPKTAKQDPTPAPAPAADGAGIINLYYPSFTITINASKIYTSTAPSEIYGPNGTVILNATTDIDRVDFLDARTKKIQSLAVPRTQEQRKLNLAEEAAEFARIITEKDTVAEAKLREVSLGTVKVTEDLRRQNGLLFGVER